MYEIYVDASIDVENSYITDNNIHFIPMKYMIDDQEYVMDRQQTEEELDHFYQKMKDGSITGTSQITPYTYEQVFRKEAEQGHNVLYLCLSSGLSSTYASSLNAAQSVMEDFPDVKIESVYTLGATGGVGLLLMQAIKGRDEGKTISENAAYLRQIAPDIGFWFMVEDLEYLKRGGRVSATAAFAGNVLNLKPVLKINDEGKLINISKQRGVQRAVKYLLECYEGSYDDTISSDVIVAHAVCKERAEKMRDEILRINPGAKVQICPMGPVIGSHTGPGFAAIIHFGNRNFR
jgi:DegV family protein with EDD domain